MSNPEYHHRSDSGDSNPFRAALHAYESALRSRRVADSGALLERVCVTARHESIPPEQLLIELKAMIDRAVAERPLDEREAVRRQVIGKAIETYYEIAL